MPGSKRGLSDGTESVHQSKVPNITTPLSAHRPPSHFTIEVRCPSKEKAKRKDRKPPATMEEMRAQFAVSAVHDNPGLTDEEERGKFGGDEGYDNDEHSDADSEEGEEDVLDANHSLFQEFKWLKPLNRKITLTPPNDSISEHKHASHAFNELIQRGRMRYAFYEQLEQPSEDTLRLVFDIFDRYGRLREEFKSHQIKKGSGIWGEELDSGDLLLIEKVYIELQYRRQGLAQKLVRAMIEEITSAQ